MIVKKSYAVSGGPRAWSRSSAPASRINKATGTLNSPGGIDRVAHEIARQLQSKPSHVHGDERWMRKLIHPFLENKHNRAWTTTDHHSSGHHCPNEVEELVIEEDEEELLLASIDLIRLTAQQVLAEELGPLRQLSQSLEAMMKQIISVSRTLSSLRDGNGPQAE